MPRWCASLGPMLKYVHARMPGRELLHLVPPHGLESDDRFVGDAYVKGRATTLCGKTNDVWIVDRWGERCPWCEARR